MRAWVLLIAIGCGRAAGPTTAPGAAGQGAAVPRLQAPPVLDLDSPDAPYRAAVALQLQPGWGQFLEDCRLRLPASHPLNVMALASTADLTIDASGTVVDVALAGSGNADFDRAIRQVITDAAPLPRPPAPLWSDDDRVHLRWLFARDRRQAGPATAVVVEQLLPVRDVTARLIKAGDLTRAARRIKREPAGSGREAATTDLMIAGLREALTSSDGPVRRAAVEAIGAAGVGVLADEVHEVLTSTSDVTLRLTALQTLAAMGDHGVARELLAQLRTDIKSDRRLALAEAEALIRIDAGTDVVAIVASELIGGANPNPIALHVAGLFEAADRSKDLKTRYAKWQRSADARVRSGVCAAQTRAPDAIAIGALASGLKDRDANVRAACLDMIVERMGRGNEPRPDAHIGSANIDRVVTLVRDRDVLVRATAIRALAALQAESPPKSFPDLSADVAAEVRVAYLRAIAVLSMLRPMDGGRERVLPLLDDRDGDVRAAAWDALVVLLRRPTDRIDADPPPDDLDRLIARATRDSAPQVRRSVIEAVTDDVLLIRLAGSDDDADVRTRALVRVTKRSGRAQSADLLLGRFAAATPGSPERVRAALAWHLAR